jgi:hypothetical protein
MRGQVNDDWLKLPTNHCSYAKQRNALKTIRSINNLIEKYTLARRFYWYWI